MTLEKQIIFEILINALHTVFTFEDKNGNVTVIIVYKLQKNDTLATLDILLICVTPTIFSTGKHFKFLLNTIAELCEKYFQST